MRLRIGTVRFDGAAVEELIPVPPAWGLPPEIVDIDADRGMIRRVPVLDERGRPRRFHGGRFTGMSLIFTYREADAS